MSDVTTNAVSVGDSVMTTEKLMRAIKNIPKMSKCLLVGGNDDLVMGKMLVVEQTIKEGVKLSYGDHDFLVVVGRSCLAGAAEKLEAKRDYRYPMAYSFWVSSDWIEKIKGESGE